MQSSKRQVFGVLYYSVNLITCFCAKYFEFVIIRCVIKGLMCTGVFHCLMCLNMIIWLYNLVRLSGYIRVSVDTQISTSTSVCKQMRKMYGILVIWLPVSCTKIISTLTFEFLKKISSRFAVLQTIWCNLMYMLYDISNIVVYFKAIYLLQFF